MRSRTIWSDELLPLLPPHLTSQNPRQLHPMHRMDAPPQPQEDILPEPQQDAPLAPRDDGLEHQYDVVIVGTGLVEAMLAAALTKVGKSVLQYEKHDYYGGEDWPSFRLDDLRAWAEAHYQAGGSGPAAAAGAAAAVAASQAELRPTPPVLQRRWPSIRWRTAGGIDREAKEEEEEKEAGATQSETQDKEKSVAPIDPEAPAQSWVVPLPQTAHASICVLQINERPESLAVEQLEQPPPAVAEETPVTAVAGAADQEIETTPDSSPSPSPSPPSSTTTPAAAAAHEKKVEESPSWDLTSLLAKSREFNIDLTPVVLMAGGDMIGPLLSSGVANYLEFRPFQALYIASPSLPSSSSSTTSSSSSSSSSTSTTLPPPPPPPLTFHQVPCSKPDVFATHLLPAKEKRQLMKFLQLVADWGFRSQSGKTAQVRNEVELGQGRSLQRPQNKASVDMEGIDKFLKRPFGEYLNFQKMEGHLQWVVRHALALLVVEEEGEEGREDEVVTTTTEEGLGRVWGHLQGLGRYGKTAFLWPLFGGGDLTQAFCRTASVWGATYLLREQPAGMVLHPGTGECLGVMDKNGERGVACEYVVLGEGCLPEGWRKEGGRKRSVVRRIVLIDRLPAGLLVGKKEVGGAAAGASNSSSSSSSSSSSTAGHCGGVIPPGTLQQHLAAAAAAAAAAGSSSPLSHPHPTVHFYCVDSAARCSPQGIYILYLSTITTTTTSSSSSGSSNSSSDGAAQLLEAATAALVGNTEKNVLWAVTYELPLEPNVSNLVEAESTSQDASLPSHPSSSSSTLPPPTSSSNVLLIHREPPEFYLHSPLKQAQSIFEKICPGEAFLPAEVPEGVLQFEFLASHEEEDQEEAILEKAMARAALTAGSGGGVREGGEEGEKEGKEGEVD